MAPPDHQHHSEQPHLLDYSSAALFLCLPKPTLRRLVHELRIPHTRLGPRTVRFQRESLMAWLAEHEVPPVHDDGGCDGT